MKIVGKLRTVTMTNTTIGTTLLESSEAEDVGGVIELVGPVQINKHSTLLHQ